MVEFTRRQLVKYAAGAGAAVFVPWQFHTPGALASPLTIPTLPGTAIPKYQLPLIVPPAMPRTSILRRGGKNVDYYEIAVRQFHQHILPHGTPGHDRLELRLGQPSRLVQLPGVHDRGPLAQARPGEVDQRPQGPSSGDFLPHLLPVDPTLHWANPPGGIAGRDERPELLSTPGPYTGPVPIVTHLHGSEGVPGERRLRRGLVPARRREHSLRVRDDRHVLRRVQAVVAARRRAGARARRCSSTRTTSARRRSGTTTTRSA